MSAVVVVLVAISVGWGQASAELKHRRLINHGVMVKATAVEVSGVTKHQNPNFSVMRDQQVQVRFNAIMPDGKITEFGGYLEPAVEGRIRVEQVLDILVDPNDPNHWSEDVDPKSWWQVLSIPLFMMLPLAVIAMLIAEFRRRQVLAVWREGLRVPGVVIDVRHSAAAPRSRLVHFTIAEGRDRRILKTFFPAGAGVPRKGDPLTLIVPQERAQDSLVAELYARPGDQPTQTD
jgi:hypothetical protein